MAISQQKLKKIEIKQLKGLKEVEIDLSEKCLTAIMGPNGIGKSTILHALSCINSPINGSINHLLSEFFTPTTHSTWQGSNFFIYQDYKDGENVQKDYKTHFRKVRERWAPRYNTRIERYISYISIKTCVPKIELETQLGRIKFNTMHLTDKLSNKVKELAGYVMNRKYNEYNEHKTGRNKQYIGVSTIGINYSSLSMGAGEQRIFYILSEVLKAPIYGLILIDEIDLLLHQDALFRLLKKLKEEADKKHLQIIFTTHAQSILNLDFIAFRHLYQTEEKTLCFSDTKPDILQRLTGEQVRTLEIFVEDDLAKTLINKICSEEGMKRHVSVKCFGAADNCFTSVCGAIINKLTNVDNMLFVLDGDKYNTDEEKQKRIKKVLTGDNSEDDNRRKLALSKITQFVIPDNNAPETYFHGLISKLNETMLNDEEKEIVKVAKEIVNPGDSHKYFDDLITRFDWERNTGLSKLVDILSKTNDWNKIKSNIKKWLDTKRELVISQ